MAERALMIGCGVDNRCSLIRQRLIEQAVMQQDATGTRVAGPNIPVPSATAIRDVFGTSMVTGSPDRYVPVFQLSGDRFNKAVARLRVDDADVRRMDEVGADILRNSLQAQEPSQCLMKLGSRPIPVAILYSPSPSLPADLPYDVIDLPVE